MAKKWQNQQAADIVISREAPRGGDDNLGWGFNTPTQDLADSYEAGDTRSDATIIFRGETLFDGRLISESVLNPMYNQKAYSSTAPSIREGEKNIRVLRYAEVLLMNAEAALETGRDAASPLNTVRNRAGLGNAPTVDKAAIWRERRHELAFEHDRFFDLVRATLNHEWIFDHIYDDKYRNSSRHDFKK